MINHINGSVPGSPRVPPRVRQRTPVKEDDCDGCLGLIVERLQRLPEHLIGGLCAPQSWEEEEVLIFWDKVPSGYVNSLLLKMAIYSGFSH
jgi:hypothetical protein